MQQADRDRLGKIITLTAMYYGRQITREVVSLMIDDLESLPVDEVIEAYERVRRDPKNRTMPLPAIIIGMLRPNQSPDAEAREVIEKIKLAISKFGWPEGAAARAFIGPIGWKIIEGLGGWMRVCESDFLHNPGLLAQARNRAEDIIVYEKVKPKSLSLNSPSQHEQLPERD